MYRTSLFEEIQSFIPEFPEIVPNFIIDTFTMHLFKVFKNPSNLSKDSVYL